MKNYGGEKFLANVAFTKFLENNKSNSLME